MCVCVCLCLLVCVSVCARSQIWWLDSELTCGQLRPLLFTQGHSVCNRSFFPCFDTPAVKSTYSATIRVSWTRPDWTGMDQNPPLASSQQRTHLTLSFPIQVPDGVTVLMSASRSSYSKLDRVFQFSMEFPVPSYLVALVAGDLQHVDVGPRSVPGSAP